MLLMLLRMLLLRMLMLLLLLAAASEATIGLAFEAAVTIDFCHKTELCHKGIPLTCNLGCAAILVPATQACTAPGGFLASTAMHSSKAVLYYIVQAAGVCSSETV